MSKTRFISGYLLDVSTLKTSQVLNNAKRKRNGIAFPSFNKQLFTVSGKESPSHKHIVTLEDKMQLAIQFARFVLIKQRALR